MKIISLFSGAGGLDLGLIRAGHKIVWANDIFEDAVSTYRRNIGGHIDMRNIMEIPSSEIPKGDVVVGGFPCQGFSIANWGREASDSRNKLYVEMVRVIHDKQPKFFLAENVKGIVSLGEGKVLKKILSDFSDIGYNVFWDILNSADYGVPQKRLRFIILGVRSDICCEKIVFPPETTHQDPNLNSPNQKLLP